ncbi:MAG: RnfABCDGE type electron transport complex subunit B [Candidatus Marinimicrobia bacterium]|nr:RnfABCDGE type electron transport complex subunit B [Candidatus Neomarinimicrobiota bacterium]MCF7903802.1 RnfABCDGE type electron transport complex subunit B [Candidatus Neomarinimicrobiota bacterium]
MDLASIAVSMLSMGGLGALFATGLVLANKKLYVEEDPRIGQVASLLPGANCGGCGLPGCANFAENLVGGNIEISGCPVCNDEARAEIATIMGLEAQKGEKIVARVLCQGGNYESAKKGEYLGIESCTAAHISGGGDKLCLYGCLGYGECVDSCPFDALHMSENGLPVVDEDTCTGCGNCEDACPRGVIGMHPVSHTLFVACKNEDSPKDSRQVCIKACVGCGLCVRGVEEGLMTMENNLARIDYHLYGTDCRELPTEKCSTNAIILLESVSKEKSVERAEMAEV